MNVPSSNDELGFLLQECLPIHCKDDKEPLVWHRVTLTDAPERLVLSNDTLSTVPEWDGKVGKVSEDSCILGLLKYCHTVVQVVNCQVRFWNATEASVLVTLRFPLMKDGDLIGSMYPRLHSATEALLNLLKTDWDLYDACLQHMPSSLEKTRSCIPSSVSLAQVYQRLEPSPLTKHLSKHCIVRHKRASPSFSTDILVECVAPFLTASELQVLRSCGCSAWRHALRAVVPGLRLKKLYKHQVRSLEWMREREACCASEGELMEIDDDSHGVATGGWTKLLVAKSDRSKKVRVYQQTGRPCHYKPSDKFLERSVARGGLLCDDPGLGKTITVLSLWLQTIGCKPCVRSNGEAVEDEDIFRLFWEEQYVVPEVRRQPILRLFNRFLRQAPYLSPNFPVAVLRKEMDYNECFPVFADFEKSIMCAISDSRELNDSQQQTLKRTFEGLVAAFKEDQVNKATKTFQSAQARPNSRVAALLDRHHRANCDEAMLTSHGTLIVVPSVLLDHWQLQIESHVDLSFVTNRIPLIFTFNTSTKEKEIFECEETLDEASTHDATIFIDRGRGKQLPPPEFLARFRLVLTTTQRFTNEWKHGSYEAELRQVERIPDFSGYSTREVCPLLKVLWYRMVIDEGHSMAKDKENSSMQFASWISAERRWAMTGTPTKQDSSNLGQIKGLMRFLQHNFFTSRFDGDKFWKQDIDRSWRFGSLVAFLRVKGLLHLLMKRHTKLDIEELPAPSFDDTIVPMSPIEVTTYNTLVASVQSNIKLTSLEGKTSGKQDSLLVQANSKHAKDALSNIRRVCVGFARVVPTISDKFFALTLQLSQEQGIDVEKMRRYMVHTEDEKLTCCSVCQMELSLLIAMSCCGALVCSECMDVSVNECMDCGAQYDVDELQRLQPGFNMTWKYNLVPAQGRRNAAARQGNNANNNANQNNVNAPPVALPAFQNFQPPLIQPAPHANRQRRPQRNRVKFGDGHVCEYRDPNTMEFRLDRCCILCRHEHNECNLMNETQTCKVCDRRAQDCPGEESKPFYLVDKILKLYSQPRTSQNHRPLKVIVFSQFRLALNQVGSRLLLRFGSACVAEYWGKYRRQELHKFTHNPECFCLLLTKDGSEGLDLSFVTHIFFLEEIWDQALKDQAVARAWRMGATGQVQVETMIAQHSVEETMWQQEEDHAEGKRGDQSKTHRLLKSLRYITDYHCFAGRRGDGKFVDGSVRKKLANRKWKQLLDDSKDFQRPAAKRVKFS